MRIEGPKFTMPGGPQRVADALSRGDLTGGGILTVRAPRTCRSAQSRPGQIRTYLISAVPTRKLTLLREQQSRVLLEHEVLVIADDWSTWVLTCHVQSAAHRLFIPLVGSEVSRLIQNAVRGSVALTLNSDAEESTEPPLELQIEMLAGEAEVLRSRMRPSLPTAAPDRLVQSIDVLLSSSGPEDALSDVSVAVVMPDDLQDELRALMPDFPF